MKNIFAPAALAVLALGCGSGNDHEMVPLPSATKYSIELKTVHSHIYKKVELIFTVRDREACTNAMDATTCPAVKGLPVVAFYRLPGGAQMIEQPLEAGKLADNGDGTYSFFYTFGALGAHVLGLKFDVDGRTFSNVWTHETSRGGGERYFCDTNMDNTPDHAFQIRWNASVPTVVADGATEVKFSVELMRSINTPLNTEQPWTNVFNHLGPTELMGAAPSIKLMSGKAAGATELATMPSTYAGKGVFDVKRVFTAADLGGEAERTFWLAIRFSDTGGCTVDGPTAEEEYHFPVKAR